MKCQYFVPIVLGVVGVAYLIQFASPLRVNTDALRFLEIGASASHGKGFLNQGEPSSYPSRLSADSAGSRPRRSGRLGHSHRAEPGVAGCGFGKRRLHPAQVVSARHRGDLHHRDHDLLCWVVIKPVTLPLSDLPSFGISLARRAVFTGSFVFRGVFESGAT
jgi:hypothetical protein